MTRRERERFDEILDGVVRCLPAGIRRLMDEVPVIVLDRPTREMLDELARDLGEDVYDDVLAGLHTGVSITERSIEHSGHLPEEIHLFREGIIDMAGGWEQEDAVAAIREEIRVTLLHEIGHHFGLEEDDLEDLGYG